MNHHQESMLAEMGIGPFWTLRQSESVSSLALSALASPPPFQSEKNKLGVVEQNLEKKLPDTQSNLSACLVCGMTHVANAQANDIFVRQTSEMKCLFIDEHVLDAGSPQADTLLGAGEALFNNMLHALDMQSGVNAGIISIVKTKMASDKVINANKGEMLACVDCLKTQIQISRPNIIISLGKTAAISLLGLDNQTPIGDLRGRAFKYDGLSLFVTYDLLHLLTHPKDKNVAWSDLCLSMNSTAAY